MAYETKDLQVKITGDASSFSKSIDDVDKSSKNASLSFGKMAAAVALGNAIWDGAKMAMKGVVDIASDVIKAAVDEQNRIAQTNAVLKSTAGVAGLTSNKITELADSFARTTPFADDVVRSAENLLLTFTNIGKDIFPQATETVLNMAQALGEDTSSAAIQLGKALQDPVLGITALRRVGVNFNDAQKEVVKQMVATGNSAGAQALILKELQTEFGGSAKAAGETFGGQLKILGNDVDMMKESIGGAILTAIEPFIKKLTDWAATPDVQKKIQDITKWVGELAGKMAHWITDVAIPWITKLWPDIQNAIKTTWDMLTNFVNAVVNFSKWVIANKDWLLPVLESLAALKLALILTNEFRILSGLFDTFTLVTMPAADLAISTFVAANIIAPAKIVASWVAGNAKIVVSWTIAMAKNIATGVITVAKMVSQAIVISAKWVAQAAVTSAAWVVTELPKIIVMGSIVAAKAALHAADTSLAWVINAIRVSFVWTTQELPKLIVGFITTSASATKEAAITSAVWIKNAAITSYTWVTTELPKIIIGFITTSASAAWHAILTSAAWIKSAAITSFTWVTQELPKIVLGFGATSSSAIVQALATSGAWIASATESTIAWVMNSLPKIIAAFVAMTASSVVQAGLASAAWVTAAVTTTETWGALSALIATPLVMPAIAIGAALLAIQQVLNAYNDMKSAIDNEKKAARGLAATQASGLQDMLQIAQNGIVMGKSASQIASAKSFLHNAHYPGYDAGGFTGQGSQGEIAGIVHKGEYVLPQSAVDQNSGTPKIGNNINLSVNVGMYAGMPVEKREIALSLYRELVRAARSQGVQMPMIGAVGVQ